MTLRASRHRLPAFIPLLVAFVAMLLARRDSLAGAQGLTLPPNGDNPQASVMQAIGPVRVTIEYSSPRVVRGDNDRHGKIWGELVPYGLSDLGFNGCKDCPWRGGANENTIFTVTHAIKVQGQPLPAGRYGLHFIPGKDEWTVIFSKDADSWGSFWYDPALDALRVTAKPAKSGYHEWLTYEFPTREADKVTAALEWEDLQIPLNISVDNVNELWVDGMRRDLRTWAGFFWQNWDQAANFCATNKVDLPEGLKWAERAVSDPYSGGQENFTTLSTLARLQDLNGKHDEAKQTFEKAINHRSAGPTDIHLAARGLLADGKKEEAMRVWQLNAKKFPDQWPVHVGLMRGYSAMGDQKKALAEAKLAFAQAPDPANKKNLEGLVKQLEAGKAIN
jgi:tetratricopeptide (TPR) repeat protein